MLEINALENTKTDKQTNKPKAIFLMGPTASGKTDLACTLVEKLNCEIISVDSALVYKDMDIGTAKPDAKMLKKAPHHLINLIDPTEQYSAADFAEQALVLMADITARGKTPLLVGGTMLYYRVLLMPLDDMPLSDQGLRAKLNQQWEDLGAQVMHQKLEDIDAVSAQKIHPNHKQRLLRALEVFELTGEKLSDMQKQSKDFDEKVIQNFAYDVTQIVVNPEPRKKLHERIAKRYEIMIEQGFEQEVRALYERGDLTAEHNAIRCVGYRQMWSYLEGEIPLKEMIERGIIATRQLAKRQLTWLRGWPCLTWFDSMQPDMIDQVFKFLKGKGY
ncbi:MAG: tRNA (adenosine(37)-N6)-dimethylallyltransferase MiaA [Saccharospirillaceae bacterium]|nr:tRNA (adenosine(37)-N6)-dimethylallyltransferase MiaA [Pseudomonadales bacterium]NRB81788.1 tRNA (adenosine(37)-N6)-dimethylallyltransferase MiaA [Saccharospirillaceae bacterium]